MVEMLTRPSPCLRLFRQPPSDSGDWKQAEFVIGNTPHCPPVIPRLPPAVGKLRTVLYQPFTATFLIQPVSETSRYRYTQYIGLYRVYSLSLVRNARRRGYTVHIFRYEQYWIFRVLDIRLFRETLRDSEYSRLRTFRNLTIGVLGQ